MNKRRKKALIIDAILLVLIAVALGVSMAWSLDIELKLGLLHYVSAADVDEKDIVVIERKTDGVRVSADGGQAELYVHYVDVGQGDCCIMELPDGKTMIIDGANRFSHHKTAVMDFIQNTLPSDFKYFDYAILTHADADHCGSLDDVLNAYPAYVVYRPNVKSTYAGFTDPGLSDLLPFYDEASSATYKDFLVSAYKSNNDFTPHVIVTDASDDTQTIKGGNGDDEYSLTFYSPLYSDGAYSDANNYSSIMIFEYRGFKFALSGDAEKENEAEFVEKVKSAKTDGVTDKYDVFTDTYNVNVIKAGHHGSRTSTSQEYLDILTTESGAKSAFYIFSCNADDGNKYGHPHSETLDRLEAMGVPESNILRTDLVGDITLSVRVDENGAYNLFYGDKASAPIEPDDPPELPPCIYPEVLVYREFMGVKLKWGVVAWTAYAVLVVVAAVHVMLSGENESGNARKKVKR